MDRIIRKALCSAFALCLLVAGFGFASPAHASASPAKPARAAVSSLSSPAAKKLVVKVKKAKRATGYQYVVSTSKKFTANVKKKATKKRTATFTGLKAGKKYYVRVRAYRKAADKTVWGKWSTVKAKTVKKAAAATATETEGNTAVVTVRDWGSFKIQLDPKSAPITVANFKKLANEHFYDGLSFHRLMSGFCLQGGDPNGDGTGGSSATIKGEFKANGVSNPLADDFVRGTVAMARSDTSSSAEGPTPGYNSASSQFFITLATSTSNSTSLNGKYAAFGTIDETEMEKVDAIVSYYSKFVTDSSSGTIYKSVRPMIESVRIV